MSPMSQWKASNCFTRRWRPAKQKIRDNKQIQAQKQINANDIILKSCDTILLKTLPLVVQCKNFRWWVRKHETIGTKNFAFLIVTLLSFFGQYFPVFRPNTGKCRPEKAPYLDTFQAMAELTTII